MEDKFSLLTWNLNSLKVRLPLLLEYIRAKSPSVLCLQELKCVPDASLIEPIEALGYHMVSYGQKTYNGVAICSRQPIYDVCRGFKDGYDYGVARLIGAKTYGVRIYCVYVPNGASTRSEKYHYKLEWLNHLHSVLRSEGSNQFIIAGDFNIAPDDRDLYDPGQSEDPILFSDHERSAYHRLLEVGLNDTYRKFHELGGEYSWWDYRQMGFAFDKGFRIDHILATDMLNEACESAWIDRWPRYEDKPSDHTPVWASFKGQ